VEIPVTRPAKVRQVGVAPLPDKRLQLWAVGEAGQLLTRTRKATPHPNASWEPWDDFKPLAPPKVCQVGVAPLPDGRLQLWAVDEAGQLFSTWKTTTDPDAPWKGWHPFKPLAPFTVRQVGVAPLPDKRLQLWAVGKASQLFSTCKATSHPDAPWEPWKDFLP
jgi:hypothetical protein